MIFGKMDNHVPPAGRDLIRKELHDNGVLFSFYEFTFAQHAYVSFFSLIYFPILFGSVGVNAWWG
jgi:dienelactone hydrolase